MVRSKPTLPARKTSRTARTTQSGLSFIDAPWRHAYFDNRTGRGCFICRAIRDARSNDPKNLLLYRGRHAVIVLNRYPYTMGALMVAPSAHIAGFRDVDDETMLEMTHLIGKGMDILDRAVGPKAYNVGINLGKEAGAGLDAHLHVHLVPRWGADTNFMTSIAGARVLAESPGSMYRRLTRAMKQLQDSKGEQTRSKRA